MTEQQEKRLEDIRATFDGKLVYSAAVKDLLSLVDTLREELKSERHIAAVRLEGLRDYRDDLVRAERERDALLKFKAYVHGRLDEAGVPVDPESPHKAAGCRIGGRLDVLLYERDAIRARVSELEGALKVEERWLRSEITSMGRDELIAEIDRLRAMVEKQTEIARELRMERDRAR